MLLFLLLLSVKIILTGEWWHCTHLNASIHMAVIHEVVRGIWITMGTGIGSGIIIYLDRTQSNSRTHAGREARTRTHTHTHAQTITYTLKALIAATYLLTSERLTQQHLVVPDDRPSARGLSVVRVKVPLPLPITQTRSWCQYDPG